MPSAFSHRFFAVAAAWCFLSLALVSSAQAQTPPTTKPAAPLPPLTERMNEFPTLYQMDARAGFSDDGAKYCGPVAASNALLWLAAHGYPRLLPDANGDTLYGGLNYATSKTRTAQIALVHAIMDGGFVKMRPEDGTPKGGGTSMAGIARGVQTYVESKGYEIKQIKVAQLITEPSPDYPPAMLPNVISMQAVKKAFADGAMVWLNIGWYDRVGDDGLYTWKGGHFVTLVGYGKDAAGNADDSALVFRDPARNAGRNYPNEFVRVRRLTEGFWNNGHDEKGHESKGYYVVDGLFISPRTTAILTSATILVLKPPTKPLTP